MTKKRNQLTQLFDDQNGFCCYCDGAMWLPGRERQDAARTRLGIPNHAAGSKKMLIAAKATREHIQRAVDGGTNALKNLKAACNACNVRRMDSDPDVHRMDMQVMVAAGLHPTNRPKIILDHAAHMRAGRLALRKLRKGVMPEERDGGR